MKDLSNIKQVLLDTNAFLFFINNDRALGDAVKELFESDVDLFLSPVSLWEIAIKYSIGKISLPDTFGKFIPDQLQKNEIELLPISLIHFEKVSTLPFHHKDPFDRLIIAQALVEDLPVARSDAAFDSYGIFRIW